jgi:hypothetical protein
MDVAVWTPHQEGKYKLLGLIYGLFVLDVLIAIGAAYFFLFKTTVGQNILSRRISTSYNGTLLLFKA